VIESLAQASAARLDLLSCIEVKIKDTTCWSQVGRQAV